MIIKLDRLGIKVTLRLQNRSPQKLENVLNNFHLQNVCPICCTVTWSHWSRVFCCFRALDIGSKPRGGVLVI